MPKIPAQTLGNRLLIHRFLIKGGHLEILKLLENHGADFQLHAKARDSNNQYCALAMAAINGHLDIVIYLEEKFKFKNENFGEF